MVAIFQGRSRIGRTAENLGHMRRAAAAARAFGARILVCPELFLTGYNLGDATGPLAEPVDGPSLAAAAAIAREHGIGLVLGFPERAGDAVFNAAAAIDPDGGLLAVHRKCHLFGPFERAAFRAGDDLTVVALAGRRVGLAICYDVEFPEVVRALAGAGAEIIAAPTALMDPYGNVATTLVRARALECAVPVLYSNYCGADGDLVYAGSSAIVRADGTDAARAGRECETLLAVPFEDLVAAGAIPPGTYAADLRPEALAVRGPEGSVRR